MATKVITNNNKFIRFNMNDNKCLIKCQEDRNGSIAWHHPRV